MRDLTIKEVIKAVPMDEKLRQEVLSQYDSYDEVKKFTITKACWEAFNAMEDNLKIYYQEVLMDEVAEGERTVDNINDAILEEVERDIEERISGVKQDHEELDTIRQHLEKLIQKDKTDE